MKWKKGLSKAQKETLIQYNEAHTYATVETYNNYLKARLEELSERIQLVRFMGEQKDGCVKYRVPRKWIRVSPPRNIVKKLEAERGLIEGERE